MTAGNRRPDRRGPGFRRACPGCEPAGRRSRRPPRPPWDTLCSSIADEATSWWTVPAPISMLSPCVIPGEPRDARDVDQHPGSLRRSFISGMRLCPPASSLPRRWPRPAWPARRRPMSPACTRTWWRSRRPPWMMRHSSRAAASCRCADAESLSASTAALTTQGVEPSVPLHQRLWHRAD